MLRRLSIVLTICPPVWRCCWWSNMAESSDSPLRAQYLLENIIMAGCILGTGSGQSFITWDEAMGNQWVYEYQGSSLLFAAPHTDAQRPSVGPTLAPHWAASSKMLLGEGGCLYKAAVGAPPSSDQIPPSLLMLLPPLIKLLHHCSFIFLSSRQKHSCRCVFIQTEILKTDKWSSVRLHANSRMLTGGLKMMFACH